MRRSVFSLLVTGASSASAALQVDFGNSNSVRDAARDVANDVMSYYPGDQPGETPGLLSKPRTKYYWWSSSVLWSTMADYWWYTSNNTYNNEVVDALVWQNGYDMSRAGRLAQGVFDTQAERYDTSTCGGGIRMDIVPSNGDYNIKNTESNAAFLDLAARLARYSGNQTYAEWVEKTWTWMTDSGLIDKDFNVFYGLDVDDCTVNNEQYFSHEAGLLLQGAAYMYNQTTSATQAVWRTRLEALTNTTLAIYFPSGIIVELLCEGPRGCDHRMTFYKGMTLRALMSVANLAPFLRDQIVRDALQPSAEAAVKTCNDGSNGRECAFRWTGDRGSEKPGAAPIAMNALSALLGMSIDERYHVPLATNATKNAAGPLELSDDGGEDGGSDSGSDARNQGVEDSKSAAATTHVAVGLMMAAFIAALV
ncbi:hypothetical protein N0V88_002747 [Collariella sp. IMI 366227]|nr:hypothetical protein N0V88_002747 [Collariella sp. IMI 366227]